MRKFLAKFWPAFRMDRRGGTAMIIGLSLPVIALAIGGAIDFSRMAQIRSLMQDAVDNASVGSVSVNSVAFKAGLNGSEDRQITPGKKDAKTIFWQNMPPVKDIGKIKLTTRVEKKSGALVSTVTAETDYHPYILDLVGFTRLPIKVTSTSQSTTPPYIDFHLLLDNTPSMGVGATMADIDTMVAATSKNASDSNCAFACHQMDKNGSDYYALAKKLGVTTRIDVVRLATQNLMVTAKNTETLPKQFRMAIYHFGVAADKIDAQAPPAYRISSLTDDLDQSAKNAAAIDLMTIPYQNYNSDRQTNLTSVLKSMDAAIPTPGDGSNANKPQQVLFFVSDGTNDGYDCAYSNGGSCRRITPLDTSVCTALKNRGVRIAVLYTTYLPLPTNGFYNQYLAKYVTPTSQLSSQMQACASPNLFFEVSPSEGISDAMNTLFTKVVSVVKINS